MIMRSIRYAIFILSFLVLPAAAMAQTGSITGTVTVTNDVPLHDASVTVIGTGQTTATDAEGKFEITGVPAGRQTIRVHVEGFSDAVQTVTVAANSSVAVDIKLEIAALREQVTVTASGTEQSVMESFQTVNSVGSTRIAEKAATSIGEVLETETGVAKRSFGPGASRPIIRGFDGDRVLVLQDGVRTGSIASQSGDHGEPIDPLAAERIEVVKGPATLLYGSNAIGGVVNVIGHHENDFYPGFRGYATGVAGTANSQAGFSGGAEYGINNWLFRGSVGAQRTGDYDTPIGPIPNSSSRSNTGSFGGGYYAPKGWLSGTFTADIRRFGVPFAGEFHGHHEEGEEHLGEEHEHEEIDVDLRSRRYSYRIAGGLRDLTNAFIRGVQYSLDYTDYRHKELEVHTEHDETEVGTVFDNRTFSYRSLFEQQKHGRLTGRFGFEGFARDYLVEGEEQLITGKVKHNSFSVFALEEVDLERVKFQFGGRIENNRYSPENAELLERSFTGFSGGAGINVPLWEGGSFVTNYTFSNRAPALEELYNFGPHVGTMTYEIGDQALRNETSNGLDISLRHSSGRFRFFGDVYYYDINDFVYLAPLDADGDGEIDVEDGLPVARYTQGDASYFGAELNADVQVNDFVAVFVGLDTVRAKLDNGLNIPRIPPARARVGLDLRYKDLSLRPEAVFSADQEKTYPLETRTAGYGIFNLAGSYAIGRAHHAHVFSFNAFNLTNRLYRNHTNFVKDLMPEIGRGIRFSYTVRFF